MSCSSSKIVFLDDANFSVRRVKASSTSYDMRMEAPSQRNTVFDGVTMALVNSVSASSKSMSSVFSSWEAVSLIKSTASMLF